MPTILPHPDPLTEPFWEAAREHRLSIQRCGACGRFNHPPQPLCGWCGSAGLAFADVTGTGRVHSLTSTVRRASAVEESADTIVVVELDDAQGVLLLGRLFGERPGWARIGEPVRVRFDAVEGSDVVLPQFEQFEQFEQLEQLEQLEQSQQPDKEGARRVE